MIYYSDIFVATTVLKQASLHFLRRYTTSSAFYFLRHSPCYSDNGITGISNNALFIHILNAVQRLCCGVTEQSVCLPLERGQIVQLRRGG